MMAIGSAVGILSGIIGLYLSFYIRQIILPGIGPAGQEKLRDAAVLIVGVGGLGSPVSLYLAAAGIGRIGLVDHDSVSLSNLQRQVIHSTEEIGRPKVESAAKRLSAVHLVIGRADRPGIRPDSRRDGQLPSPLPDKRPLAEASDPVRIRRDLPDGGSGERLPR